MGLGLGLGLEIVLGLGLGTGLALGLRVGRVLCITARSYSIKASLWRRIRKEKQNRAGNHSFFPTVVQNLQKQNTHCLGEAYIVLVLVDFFFKIIFFY